MRVLPTPYHGIVDYSVGAMLVVSPWVVDFDKVTERRRLDRRARAERP